MAIVDGKWVFPEYTELAPAVKRFFEILDSREESDNGVEFSPVKMDFKDLTISSVRVFKTAELESLLPQMKKLSSSFAADRIAEQSSGG